MPSHPLTHKPSNPAGAQLDERDTFLGVGTNRLVRWDQRVREGVVQEMSSPTVSYAGGKDYARGTNFNCMATSGECSQSSAPSIL